MADQAAADFRQETRAWLEENCPAAMRRPIRSESDVCWGGRRYVPSCPEQKLWLDGWRSAVDGARLADRLWRRWPVARRNQDPARGDEGDRRTVAAQQLRHLDARPALLKYGSEAQKLEHLPRIARGEIRWCQGYSEPNAGSDLASLATWAEDGGDHYIVSGQKVWTSYADQADWIFCLVRTRNSRSRRDQLRLVRHGVGGGFDPADPVDFRL